VGNTGRVIATVEGVDEGLDIAIGFGDALVLP
jgi:hypothetical protein